MTKRKPRTETFERPDGYCATVRKFSFRSEERALEVLDHIRRAGKMGKGGKIERRAYLCPWCSAWHLTSKDAAEVSR